MVRARAVNDHPPFLDMMADVVRTTIQRYAAGQTDSRSLGSTPNAQLPPPK